MELRIEFREAIIIFLAKRYGKFKDEANRIIKKYNLCDEQIERILKFIRGEDYVRKKI